MIDTAGWGVERWAFHLTHLLNAANPPDRHRFDVGELAKEVSRNFFPEDPISEVVEDDLDGFLGALVPSESGKRWGILVDGNASPQRQRFTIGHELGHYLLHRKKYPNGIHCDEAAVDGRDGVLVEQEANAFSATLLMPLDDFKRRISAKDVPSFDDLGACAERYDVSLTAAMLRWLRYTDRRSIMIVSTDGFANWAWSSEPAFKSGRYIRTRSGPPYELPVGSGAAAGKFSDELRAGIEHAAGVWFNEPVRELSFHATNLNAIYTLLHFRNADGGVWHAEPETEDSYDRFNRT
ncbi:MAG: ImmA/IrrE family metallo-endopeptidase [Rhizobiales bacterium]|nr:ImmA/IrrE family metallo-endopeptidase [Hyphomicrobiales bacterium]